MPISLDELADVPRFVYRDSFLTKCDDKSGYDHVASQGFRYLTLSR